MKLNPNLGNHWDPKGWLWAGKVDQIQAALTDTSIAHTPTLCPIGWFWATVTFDLFLTTSMVGKRGSESAAKLSHSGARLQLELRVAHRPDAA